MTSMVLSEANAGELKFESIAQGLARPVCLTHAHDARLFVVEQPGRIRVVDLVKATVTVFLDITDRVSDSSNEQGLLSAAFHPDFAANGQFFVNYTDAKGATVVSRFRSKAGRTLGDADSEQQLLRIDQPYPNHNGGQIKFGPDGYLYIGMGDGGAAGDPLNAGQDISTLLGAMLRIDVNGKFPYAVPQTNPFVSQPGRPEIWASGLRNPWRFSFDRANGDLYIGDVGQNAFEEVNFARAGAPGLNYGWKVAEGDGCYNRTGCDMTAFVRPKHVYGRSLGCSITGGYVYRGQRNKGLVGRYVFGDYCSGAVWSLPAGLNGRNARLEAQTGVRISSFGEDVDGELYLLDHAGRVLSLAN